jgi:peptidoglycan/LPS O-acetylase OafA/YrhL
MQQKLYYIDGIRGLSSLWVYFIHFFPYVHKDLLPFFLAYQKWNAFVPIFFIISGRVNNISCLKLEAPNLLVSSMIKRPFRLLLPLQIIMLLDYCFVKVFSVKNISECILDPIWFLLDDGQRPKNLTWYFF